MTATSWIDEAGTRPESFLVPTFRVEAGVDEGSLARVVDVVKVSYTDKINEIDSFEFTVANRTWAPADPRYTAVLPSGGARSTEDPAPKSLLPGTRVRLYLGYAGRPLVPMLTGRVVAVTPEFSDGAGAVVTIRCLSTLEELREVPSSHRWLPLAGRSTVTDVEVARQLAARHGVTLVTPSSLTEAGQRSIAQTNETDVAFLIRRAGERGYVVSFRERPTSGGGTERLMYFGPSNLLGAPERARLGDRPDPYELRWGASLSEIKPTLNLSTTRWKQVHLSFRDRRAGRTVALDYTLDRLWADEQGLNEDLRPVVEDAAQATHELSNSAVHTRDEAETLLRNKLRENFLGLLTAKGATVGLPQLRACSVVEVRGIGAPFDGTWFLTSTTHTFDDSGYRTTFEGRREQRRTAA